jgi:SAM-dependent methyltransferase
MQTLTEKLGCAKAVETEEVTSCPLCGSDEGVLLFWCVDRMNQLPGRFRNIRCGECGLIRLSTRPKLEHLGAYYPDNQYYSYSQVSTIDNNGTNSVKEDIRNSVIGSFGYPVEAKSKLVRLLSPLTNELFKKRATFGFGNRFPRYVKNGRALDIGCGSGVFLSVLKRYGWEVEGVELKDVAAKVAKEKNDINVFVGNLIEARFEESTFDFVSFNHSLEHIPNIVEILAEVKRILKPGGIIYIEVPNVASLSQRISGEYWLHWDAPRHLYSFSPSTLKKLMIKVGFSDIKIETFRADFYLHDLKYKREEELGYQLSREQSLPLRDRIWASFLRYATNVFYLFDGGSGDFISCFAQKEG